MTLKVQPSPGKARLCSPRQVLLWQTLCLLAAVGFVASCVAFRWPCRFLEDPRAEARWAQAGFLGAGLLTFAGLALLPLLPLFHRNGRGSLTVCSYCRKVHVGARQWQPFEEVFSDQGVADFSHGVCPECGARVMEDYRASRESTGAARSLSDQTSAGRG